MDRNHSTLTPSGDVQLAQGSPLNRRSVSELVADFWPLLVVLIGTLIVIAPIWGAGYPWGSDVWGHLQRANYMGSSIRQNGLFAGLDSSNWMPDWYMGDPMNVYYPP